MGVTRLICKSISAYIQERQRRKRLLQECRAPPVVTEDDAQETVNFDFNTSEPVKLSDDQLIESVLATYRDTAVPHDEELLYDQLAESLSAYDYSTPPPVTPEDAQPL